MGLSSPIFGVKIKKYLKPAPRIYVTTIPATPKSHPQHATTHDLLPPSICSDTPRLHACDIAPSYLPMTWCRNDPVEGDGIPLVQENQAFSP